jgi:adenylate cyclase
MEATSEPGHIHVSSAVKIRLEDDYIFEERGATKLKGKGELNTFYLTDRRTANH